jgi:hypothetical protein
MSIFWASELMCGRMNTLITSGPSSCSQRVYKIKNMIQICMRLKNLLLVNEFEVPLQNNLLIVSEFHLHFTMGLFRQPFPKY